MRREGTKSGEAPSSNLAPCASLVSGSWRPILPMELGSRVYHGHSVSTITLARREYRFGKHSGAATRGIRLWKKNRTTRRDLNNLLRPSCQKTYSAVRSLRPFAFHEFPIPRAGTRIFPLLLDFFWKRCRFG